MWEIKQRVLVDMAAGELSKSDGNSHKCKQAGTWSHLVVAVSCADRGAFIDQSQSFNVHMSDPNFGKLTSLHFYAWKKGLKTGAQHLGLVLTTGNGGSKHKE